MAFDAEAVTLEEIYLQLRRLRDLLRQVVKYDQPVREE